MDRVKWLVIVGCLAVTGVAYWQSASDATTSMPAAPLQLASAAVPAKNNVVRPAAPSTNAAAPAPAMNTSKAAASKAPALVTRHDSPAEIIVEPREIVSPSAPPVNAPAARLMTYERRVAEATTLAGQDSEAALVELQRLAADEPGRPEAYEAMAGISLRNRDYGQAREQIGSALAHGGKATFSLIHDHSRGNFDADDTKACVGELTILADEMRFEARDDGERFSANWPDVRDAGSNKFFGSGIGGFHVTITAAGKHKNFNLAPESKDKAEGKLILDLLSSYTRRSDRTK